MDQPSDPLDTDKQAPASGVLAARLTLKQRKFADAWLAEPNASRAARTAGYKDEKEGWWLLRRPAVVAYLQARIREGSGLGLAALRNNIVETYWSIASADIRDIVSVTSERGLLSIHIRETSEWSAGIAQAIAEVHGQASATSQTARVKLHDKLEALDKLARITGLIRKEPSGFGFHVPPGYGGGPPPVIIGITVQYVAGHCDGPDAEPEGAAPSLPPAQPTAQPRLPPPASAQIRHG
jgi:phage terminase small subunit